MDIKQVLGRLDPEDDKHWTSDGLPRVDAVNAHLKAPVTRRQITDAAPNFTRGETYPPVGTPEHEAQQEVVPEPEKADPGTPDVVPSEPTPPVAPAAAPEAPQEPAAEPAAPTAPAQPEVPTEAPAAPEQPADDAPAEPTDAQLAAFVDIEDEVVGMDPREVFADLDLVDRAIDEFGRQAEILTARREAVMEKLKDVGRRSAMLSTARNKLAAVAAKGPGDKRAADMKRYQAAQQAARAKRSEAAKRFIAAGTTADDVKVQLSGPSKLDTAMKQRKPGRDTARPRYPVAAGA